ncbi:MAG: hypothetical protein ACQESA_03355 [Patescibacteria group bacterium]
MNGPRNRLLGWIMMVLRYLPGLLLFLLLLWLLATGSWFLFWNEPEKEVLKVEWVRSFPGQIWNNEEVADIKMGPKASEHSFDEFLEQADTRAVLLEQFNSYNGKLVFTGYHFTPFGCTQFARAVYPWAWQNRFTGSLLYDFGVRHIEKGVYQFYVERIDYLGVLLWIFLIVFLFLTHRSFWVCNRRSLAAVEFCSKYIPGYLYKDAAGYYPWVTRELYHRGYIALASSWRPCTDNRLNGDMVIAWESVP